MELRIAQSALGDLENIQTYYAEQGVPEIGAQFVLAILGHAQMLADHPDAGRVVPEFNQTPIRELIHPPFRVVYLRQASVVTLIRVWRSERVLEMPEGTIAGP
jgi:plasmid stabilization system protein ParE